MGHGRRSAPGLYLEQSTPTCGQQLARARPARSNGLTITKPLTLKGAGASKVTIRPAPAVGATLAGTAPYLRDGGGNVVTVSRQSLGSTDDNENFVDISGRDDRVAATSPPRPASRSSTPPGGSPTASSARSSPPARTATACHDQLAAGRRGRRPPPGHAREEPRHDRRRALRRRARRRRRRDHDRPLGHHRLRQPRRLARRRPGHLHLRPARDRSPAASSPAR